MNILRGKAGTLLVVMVATITLMLCLPLSATAQGPEILLDPTPVDVDSPDPFTVTLKINNIPGPGSLAAYDFRITFTPGVIQFGENVGDHDWPDPIYGTPLFLVVDNAAGSVSFNDVETAAPPSGNITLVVLHGTATAALSTSTPLHFDKADILDPSGEPISATVTDGVVNVTVTTPPPPGIPTLSQWGMIGMAVLFGAVLIWFVRRRWVINASKI